MVVAVGVVVVDVGVVVVGVVVDVDVVVVVVEPCTGDCITIKGNTLLVLPPSVAVILAVPTAMPIARPMKLEMAAILVSELVQIT